MDIREINRKVIAQFRAGGEVEGMHRDRLLLLTTTGRRSGRPRTTPMMFHPDGGRLLVIASNMGAAEHPDWYLNLVADPHVTVEVGDEEYPATAAPTEGADRDRVWTEIKREYPFFVEHEEKAGAREIPVVALTRARPDPGART
jgi:deazaflavin-dependent oxidoreductase (nitroreductase family)